MEISDMHSAVPIILNLVCHVWDHTLLPGGGIKDRAAGVANGKGFTPPICNTHHVVAVASWGGVYLPFAPPRAC